MEWLDELLENYDNIDNEIEKTKQRYCYFHVLKDNYIAQCRIKTALEELRSISGALYTIKSSASKLESNLNDIEKILDKLEKEENEKNNNNDITS